MQLILWIFHKIKRQEHGAALVEFAIVLPLLLLLTLGIIDFAIMLYDQHVITNASKEAARYGIAWDCPDKSTNTVKNVAQNYCSANLITFGASSGQFVVATAPTTNICPSPTPSPAPSLQVSVNYKYNFLGFFGISNAFFGSNWDPYIQLSANTEMVCQ